MNLDQIIEQLRALNVRLAVQFIEGKTEGRCYHAQYWAVLSEYPMEREEIADLPCFRGGQELKVNDPIEKRGEHGPFWVWYVRTAVDSSD